MSNAKKLMMTAAGGEVLNVEDVFSTYLRSVPTISNQTIQNGINFADEGGMVWIKNRVGTQNHFIYDHTMTSSSDGPISPNLTSAAPTATVSVWTPQTNGFTIYGDGNLTPAGAELVTWSFRKAPKFFDVQTWTGTGANRTISHDLGSVPGCVIIKRTDFTGDWIVYHRSSDATNPSHKFLELNDTQAVGDNATYFNDTEPTSTTLSLGANSDVNGNGGTYVAYLFAHNDGDGEFGPNGDADIIKCGSYEEVTGANTEVNLGWEPQFVIKKPIDTSGDWVIHDSMRGIVTGKDDARLRANDTSVENTSSDRIDLTSTGFINKPEFGAGTIVYIAIRRGPMAVPESASDVFAIATRTNTSPAFVSGFVTDAALYARPTLTSTTNCTLSSRLCATTTTETSNSNAESTSGLAGSLTYDFQNGYHVNTSADSDIISFMWQRAPSFFDVVTYIGDGVTGSSGAVSHNLGVVPEMMWGRNRDGGSWNIYHKDILSSDPNGIVLFDTNPSSSNNGQFYYGDQTNLVQPTSTQVTLGSAMKSNGNDFFIWLFASLSGISKAGSYTGNGTNQTINCGFSAGARFVVIKRIDSTGDWYLWNTQRGIVAGNDPHMSLNTTAAEVTTDDSIDPDNSGFIVNQVSATNINVSSAKYIFYAIA